MKITEFRIGNIVRVKSPEKTKYEQPCILHKEYFTMLLEDKIDILPLPLTPQEFARLGFIYRNRQYTKPDHFLKGNNQYRFAVTVADKIQLWMGMHLINPISDKEFKYVHEIQNIWFDLTGEELSYNNTIE